MGTIKKNIEIDDEDIANIIDCLTVTRKHWIPFNDLWPFVLQHIVNDYKKQLTPEEIELTKEYLRQEQSDKVCVAIDVPQD
jgi:hypothetical protein